MSFGTLFDISASTPVLAVLAATLLALHRRRD